MHSGSPQEPDQGWVSWAWSFVPAIVDTEEEDEEGLYQQDAGGITKSPQQHTPKDPIVSIGFYCTKASVMFKVSVMNLSQTIVHTYLSHIQTTNAIFLQYFFVF